jgi:hypothetical protein
VTLVRFAVAAVPTVARVYLRRGTLASASSQTSATDAAHGVHAMIATVRRGPTAADQLADEAVHKLNYTIATVRIAVTAAHNEMYLCTYCALGLIGTLSTSREKSDCVRAVRVCTVPLGGTAPPPLTSLLL